MHTRSKLLLAGLAAALLLATAVASATAGRLSISSRNFTVTWASLHMGSTGGVNMSCPITLSGSFHSATMAKVAGALVGNVNRGTFNSTGCTGGTATVNLESLPWHLRYRAFRGTLPTISGLDFGIIGAKISVIASGAPCITQTTAENPDVFVASVSSGRITQVTPDRSASIPLRGAFLCSLAGLGIIESGSTTVTSVTVTLI